MATSNASLLQRVDVSQSKTAISSRHTAGLLCASTVPELELWLQRRVSQEDQSCKSWWQNHSFIFVSSYTSVHPFIHSYLSFH